MKVLAARRIVFVVVGIAFHFQAAAQQTYKNVCDASAAVAIDDLHFLVAEDEGDILRLYRNDASENTPLRTFDIASQLHPGSDNESDIEGAARIGDRVYWITSHGRNKKGKFRESRYRLFATDLSGASSDLTVTLVGRYDHLIRDLLDKQNWENPDAPATRDMIAALKTATRLEKEKVDELAPKEKGLNIEGLAVVPDHSAILVGVRNPIPNGKALLFRVNNPEALVTGVDSKARFGEPMLLDLGGLGMRSMAYHPNLKAFLLIAGPAGSKGNFKMFRWDGSQGAAPLFLEDLMTEKGVNPEALVVYPDLRVQILHDEGSRKDNGTACKEVAGKDKKHFSDRWIDSASGDAVDSREYKILLNNERFTHRDEGIEGFLQAVSQQTSGSAVTVDFDGKRKKKARVVTYIDSEACHLKNNGFVLRQRFNLKGGIPDKMKITLKYRGPSIADVAQKEVEANLSPKLAESKFEEDIVANKAAGSTDPGLARKYSRSANIKIGGFKKIKELTRLFPSIKALEKHGAPKVQPDVKLKRVNDFAAFEDVVEVGAVVVGGVSCDASFSFWYKDPTKSGLLVSEFSFVCDSKADSAEPFFEDIVGMTHWVASEPRTKTAIAYKDACGGVE